MRLTQREKQFAIGATVFLALIIAFQAFVRPALGRIRTLRRVVDEKREMLSELRTKSQEYNALRSQLEQIRLTIGNQQRDRQILSFIERAQRDCGLMQKVVYVTPTTTAIGDKYEKTNVEIKFAAVTLDQIIQFLLKIESSQLLIGIRSLEIKCGLANTALLDAVIQVVSLSNIEQK
jgi:type II secretory pathway component PulM